MSAPWQRFLFLRFPAAMVVLGLIAQLCAWALSSVPMQRNRTDELALAVLRDPNPYRVILLGDSITRNATTRFALGPPGEVANLATHAHFGMAGELLLLERYLSTHPAPQYVVLAFAPTLYPWVSDIRLVRYSLWYTFTRPDERSFLKTYFPGIDDRDRLPAAADLQVRIVEPMLSLLKQGYRRLHRRGSDPIAVGLRDPDPHAPADQSSNGVGTLKTAIADARKSELAPVNAAVLRRVCQLSERYHFHLKLVVPPMPAELEKALTADGVLAQLEAHIRGILAEPCRIDEVFDFNRIRTYTMSSFHIDMIHLFGDGWEQRYASDLRGYLRGLADRSSSLQPTPPSPQ